MKKEEPKRIVAGAMAKSRWGGSIREQDYVLDIAGISMAIPASYDKHPFKILVYEDGQSHASGQFIP
jgi:hypothetical protein